MSVHSPLIDPDYLRVYSTLFLVTTSVSLVTNVSVITIHSCMVYHKVADFNRVSLRLTVVACAFGLVRCIVRLAMTEPSNAAICLVDSFFLSWMEVASPLCLAFVGIHAVFVLVFNVNDPRKLEKYYYIIIILYSLTASTVTISYRNHNFPDNFKCWVRFYFGKKNLSSFAWTWYYTLLLMPAAVAVTCALILLIRYKMERYNFVVTSVRYAKNKNNFLIPAVPMRNKHVDPIKTFRNVVIRLTGYAIVPLFTVIFIIVAGFENLRGHPVNYYALIAGGLIANLQGLLISLLYYSDPAMTGTISRLFKYLRKVYVDDYPYTSDNNKTIDKGSLHSHHNDNISKDNPPDIIRRDSDCRSINVRFGRSNHDMIADDASDGGFHQGRSTPKNSHKNKRPFNPYRYHWVMTTIHWFLIKICRLKPRLKSSNSTSTISYVTKSLSSSVLTQNSLILAVDSGHGDNNDDEDTDRPFRVTISKDDHLAVSATNQPLPSSKDSVYEEDHSVSNKPTSSLPSIGPSEELGQVIRQHYSQQQQDDDDDSSLHSGTTSHLSIVIPSEEHIDRLSLLSGSIESTSPNVDFTPLDAPPHRVDLPILSITLPDQPLLDPLSPPMTICTTTISPSTTPHGVTMDPTSVLGLLDWEPTNPFHPARHDPFLIDPDGLGHGWTSLIHLQQAWVEDNRIVVSVEHWVKGYLGSRWFVAE